ncbi:MAG: hypothetical protein IPQ05_14185 [Leptospiraceae bacterium]|nr:hypothetical protein [Leptospiraceae bacterium]
MLQHTMHLIKEDGVGSVFPREKGKLTKRLAFPILKLPLFKSVGSADELKTNRKEVNFIRLKLSLS